MCPRLKIVVLGQIQIDKIVNVTDKQGQMRGHGLKQHKGQSFMARWQDKKTCIVVERAEGCP